MASTKTRTGWPKNATSLSSTVTRLAPNLRAIGVDVTRGREGQRRFIRIKKGTQSSVTSVTSVIPDTESANVRDAAMTQTHPVVTSSQARSDDGDGDDAHIPTFPSRDAY